MSIRRTVVCAMLGASLLLLAGCELFGDDGNAGRVDLTEPWRTATPAEADIDAAALQAGLEEAEALPRVLSLLVVRRGSLVLEEYFHGYTRDDLNDVRSVTKSVVSTLVGIAYRHGYIESLDETLGDYLYPGVADMDEVRRSISIRHLLTMTSGFEWPEIGGPAYRNWMEAGGRFTYVLNRPLEHTPGTDFNYNTGAVHLLGVLVEEAVGVPLEEFADRVLFDRIGIQRREWEPLPDGYVNGGAGLDLRPRDLARLGQLYLQDGWSGNERVLPEGWVEEATGPKFEWRTSFGPLTAVSYGYLWWTEEGQDGYVFLAWGYGGQFIAVAPDLELVVVTTTNWRGIGGEENANVLEKAVLSIIFERILPGVR